MKNWLSIGQFADSTGFSTKALRIYEEMGIILSHIRGENNYRYYHEDQLKLAARVKKFKQLGFALLEIKSLLQADAEMDTEKLKSFLLERLQKIQLLETDLLQQKDHIENILSSLTNNAEAMVPSQRRYIMRQFEAVSIVVTGIKDLEKTAENISLQIEAPVLFWREDFNQELETPYILIIPEDQLSKAQIKNLTPDVVVIKDVSANMIPAYLGLYSAAGPHMTTVFNADDRLSVELADSSTIRKGRTFYFSKNSGLAPQIEKIGGVISDGEEINLYGFNLKPKVLSLKLNKILGFDDEIALIASLAAVLNLGLKDSQISLPN